MNSNFLYRSGELDAGEEHKMHYKERREQVQVQEASIALT